MLCILFLFKTIQSTFHGDHSVSTKIVAPWDEIPILDQILCFISDNRQHQIKKFLTVILTNPEKLDDKKYLLKITQEFLPPSLIPLLKSHLQLGFYHPRIEMFRETVRTMGGTNYSPLIITAPKNPNFDFKHLITNNNEINSDNSNDNMNNDNNNANNNDISYSFYQRNQQEIYTFDILIRTKNEIKSGYQPNIIIYCNFQEKLNQI